MFVTLNQFYIFLACVTFGAFSGLFFSLFSVLKAFIKSKVFEIIIDIFLMFSLSIAFSIFSYKNHLPNIRIYMLAGVLIGLSMYLKSFHRILANFAKKFYNIITHKLNKGKGKVNDRNKSKKSYSGLNGRSSVATLYSSDNNGLSNDFHRGQKKSHRIFRRSNRKIRNINKAG